MASNRVADGLIEMGIALGISLLPEDKKAKFKTWLVERSERSKTNAILNLKARAKAGDTEAQTTFSKLVEALRERSARGDVDAKGLLRKIGEF